MKPCSVENCNSDNCVRGLCRYHYDKERYDKYHKSKETLTGKRTARSEGRPDDADPDRQQQRLRGRDPRHRVRGDRGP